MQFPFTVHTLSTDPCDVTSSFLALFFSSSFDFVILRGLLFCCLKLDVGCLLSYHQYLPCRLDAVTKVILARRNNFMTLDPKCPLELLTCLQSNHQVQAVADQKPQPRKAPRHQNPNPNHNRVIHLSSQMTITTDTGPQRVKHKL